MRNGNGCDRRAVNQVPGSGPTQPVTYLGPIRDHYCINSLTWLKFTTFVRPFLERQMSAAATCCYDGMLADLSGVVIHRAKKASTLSPAPSPYALPFLPVYSLYTYISY